MREQTKKDLIKEFKEILNKLIEQGILKHYPFKRDLKYFDKKTLQEGINIYSEKLKICNTQSHGSFIVK